TGAGAAIGEELETVWRSVLVRSGRPSVWDEARHGLGMAACLFEVVPRIYRATEAALGRCYPELGDFPVPAFLRFGSWIGGDRDGNPNVTPEATAETVRLQQETVLGHYLARVKELGARLSHSDRLLAPTPAFRETLRRGVELV